MRRLTGNVVLKGLYYLHSVALILINSSLMLEAPYPDQRDLHTLELYRDLRAQSKGHNHKIICVVVKNGMAETGKRAKVLKMQVYIRFVSVRISRGACCVFRGVILGCYPGTSEWS